MHTEQSDSSNASLEVRILSGMHQSASCAVGQGAVVGSDLNCDVVLQEPGMPPFLARITLHDAGWDVHACGGDHDDGDAVPRFDAMPRWNEARCVGSVWMTVARADMPWPGAPPGAQPTAAAQKYAALRPPSRAARRPWRAAVGTVALVLALGAASIVALSTPARPALAETPRPRSADDTVAELAALLRRLDIAAAVQAIRLEDGRPALVGAVHDGAIDRLMTALAYSDANPVLMLSREHDGSRGDERTPAHGADPKTTHTAGREPVARGHALPFRIRSVVSGPQPYVMLHDGTRLLTGAVHGNSRLDAIEERQIFFDQPSGVVLNR
jgi:type III secretion protein D